MPEENLEMTCKIPLELQNSYLRSSNFPENLIPSDTAAYTSKLASYKKRLDGAENDLCLIDGQDEVDKIFDIPVIDLNTADGKGILLL
jgi:hypothetical protein